jgi:hypothetical protein
MGSMDQSPINEAGMPVLAWLLESDPSIRWQVMRDLMEAPEDVWTAERARVAAQGWGAQLLRTKIRTADGRRCHSRPTGLGGHRTGAHKARPPNGRWRLDTQYPGVMRGHG